MSALTLKKFLVILPLFLLLGCAPSRDFQAPPQEGAQRLNTFPRFSDRPEAETSQFAPSESLSLARELEQEAQRLQQQASSVTQVQINSEQQAQNLVEEIEQTLREIKQGEPRPQAQP